jgi:hypothetical protein
MRVGLISGFAHTVLFREWFPEHTNTVEYGNALDAFDALERGDVDLVMRSSRGLLTMTHFMERPDFKINYLFDNPFPSTFGINVDQPLLCSIIDKALVHVNTSMISEQWLNRTYNERAQLLEQQRPWLIAAIVVFICLLAIIAVLFVRSLRAGMVLERLVKERTSELEEKADQLNKYNADLLAAIKDRERQAAILRAVNSMAAILFSAADEEAFNVLLPEGMRLMAECMDVDRAYIWRNVIRRDELYFVQAYEWVGEHGRRCEPVRTGAAFSYADVAPDWYEKFQNDECVCAAVSKITGPAAQLLEIFGVKSILAVPIHLHGQFWGFVSFDNCRTEHLPQPDEIDILHSGGLIITSVINRNEQQAASQASGEHP